MIWFYEQIKRLLYLICRDCGSRKEVCGESEVRICCAAIPWAQLQAQARDSWSGTKIRSHGHNLHKFKLSSDFHKNFDFFKLDRKKKSLLCISKSLINFSKQGVVVKNGTVMAAHLLWFLLDCILVWKMWVVYSSELQTPWFHLLLFESRFSFTCTGIVTTNWLFQLTFR